jgi:hypothetical protein
MDSELKGRSVELFTYRLMNICCFTQTKGSVNNGYINTG